MGGKRVLLASATSSVRRPVPVRIFRALEPLLGHALDMRVGGGVGCMLRHAVVWRSPPPPPPACLGGLTGRGEVAVASAERAVSRRRWARRSDSCCPLTAACILWSFLLLERCLDQGPPTVRVDKVWESFPAPRPARMARSNALPKSGRTRGCAPPGRGRVVLLCGFPASFSWDTSCMHAKRWTTF